ncbi:hypothetical protein SEA_NERGAL_50 [Mycobacterium Phage Nergal]|nr:hypothetical protein SEA_NERGAL_50 [Mycobacterium Phage Nergal]
MHALIKAAAAAAIGAVALSGCASQNQEWHNGCTVKAKDVLYSSHDGNSSREYRLTTSCGAFSVEDSFAGGFNSWDTWQALAVGKTYDLKTGGYRVGWASMFPTVLEVKPAK